MSLQFSTTYRNALLNQLATTLGGSEKIKIWTGSAPANCAAADSGSELVEFDLGASGDWGAASGGQITLSGLTLSAAAIATGTAGYFRMYEQVLSAPAAPTLTAQAGGSLAAGTVYVKVTYVDQNGEETTASAEASVAVTANQEVVVTAPAAAGTATGYKVYAATATGGEQVQNGGNSIAIGTNYTITSVATGGASPPASNSTGTCHVQGTCGTSGADLNFNNTSIASGQTVTLTGFTVTAPGA